jgi:hypothetical protein
MRKAADLAGYICKPVTHNNHQGCAQENSKVKVVDVPDLQLAGQALFHKAKSTLLVGTTKEYVGCLVFSHINSQFNQAPKEYKHGAPEVAEKRYKPPHHAPRSRHIAKRTNSTQAHSSTVPRQPSISRRTTRLSAVINSQLGKTFQLVKKRVNPMTIHFQISLMHMIINYMAKLTDQKCCIKTAKVLKDTSKKPHCTRVQGDSFSTCKKCPAQTCGIGTDFISKKRLQKHMLTMHGKSQAQAEEAVVDATDKEHTPVASTSRL